MPTKPPQNSNNPRGKDPGIARKAKLRRHGPLHESVLAGGAILSLTGLAWLFKSFTGYQSIALLYLLLVVASGLRLNRVTVLAAAATSATLWNFLFVPPRFTIFIDDLHDAIMFVTFFVVALSMGHLTSQLRRQEITERQRGRRTAALYELAHQAAFSASLDTGLRAAVNLVESIFTAKAALLLRQKDHTLSSLPHAASSFVPSEKELSVAAWVFDQRVSAGKFTDTLPDAEALHIPLQGRTAVMGVLSVCPVTDRSMDESERELLEAFALLIGLVLEKDHIIEAFKKAEIFEASETLRRALLQSVSHELKTPLAAVQTGIDALTRPSVAEETRASMLQEVQLAVRRLNRVINNLLNMTRIESGVIQPRLDWCDVGDLVQAAIELAGEHLAEHKVIARAYEGLPMMKLDQPLLEQCLCNLLLNATSNSPPGTEIAVSAQFTGGQLILSVADQGRGINRDDLPHIFEAFYRGQLAASGGTGLGLAIVSGFVQAHGGKVRALNREAGGSEFVISIPVETLSPEVMEKLA